MTNSTLRAARRGPTMLVVRPPVVGVEGSTVSESPTTWPPRRVAPEGFQFGARLLAGIHLTMLAVLLLWMIVSFLTSDDGGRAPVFYVGGPLAHATADGLAFGSVTVPGALALAVFLPLAFGSLYAVVRLARHDARPALVLEAAWLVIAAPLVVAGGSSVGAAFQFPLALALLVFGTWPAARRLVGW
ncbi:MAG: hypothetical protein AB1627_05660 [Chloroflexota bacterium]